MPCKGSNVIGQFYVSNTFVTRRALLNRTQTSEALLLIDQEGSIPLGGLRNIIRPLGELYRGAGGTSNVYGIR